MPKSATTGTSFEQFLTRAAATIPDEPARAQFTSTFSGILQQIPDETKKALDSGILMHKDYSRLITEHRQAQQQLAEREAHLQQRLAQTVDPTQHFALTTQLQTLQAEVEQLRNKAQGFDVIRERLERDNLTDLVQEDGDVFWNVPVNQGASMNNNPATTQNGNGSQQPDPNAPMLINGQWHVPTAQGWIPVPTQAAPIIPPPAPQGQQFNTQNPFMTREDLQQALQEAVLPMLAQGFSASTQAAQEVQMFCNEWEQMKGQRLDPRQVNAAWQQSGKQFDQFLEEGYKLSEVRAEKAKADYAAAVATAAQQLFDQKVAAMNVSGTPLGATQPTSPLFDAIKSRPDGLRQAPAAQVTHVPGAPTHQPATQQQQVSNPAANTPAAPVNPAQPTTIPAPPVQQPVISGAEAAARALMGGTHRGERWDITRPAG